jgi:hypothetical protein
MQQRCYLEAMCAEVVSYTQEDDACWSALPTAAAVQVYMAWCVLAIQQWALRVELVTNVIVKDAMCTSK